MLNSSTASQKAGAPRLIAGFAAGLMSLSWLMPNHYPPWLSFYNESIMGCSLSLLAMASIVAGGRTVGLPRAAWFVLGLAAIPWLQFAGGLIEFSGDAWAASLYLLAFAAAIVVGYQWPAANSASLPKLLSVAALVAACISTILGLIQTFYGAVLGIWSVDGRIGMQPTGNLGQPNNLATLICLGAIGLLYLHEQKVLQRWMSIVLLLMLVVGLAATRSRTALLFGPFIAAYLTFRRQFRRADFSVSPLIVMAATAAQWLLAFGWPLIQHVDMEPTAADLVVRGVQTNRLQIWQQMVAAVNESPWVGFGWLQNGAAQLLVADRFPPFGELYLASHNLILDLIVWCGYPLGVALTIVVAYWAVNRALRVETSSAVCGVLVLGVVGIHSMLEVAHQYIYFLIPAGLWIGVIEKSLGVREWLSGQWRWLYYSATVSIFVLIAKDYASVEQDFRILRYQQARIGTGPPPKLEYTAPFMSALSAYVRVHRLAINPQLSSADLELMGKVARRFPYGTSLYRYSLALVLANRLKEARDTLLAIRYIHGEGAYATYYGEVQRAVEAGHSELQGFLQSLPEPKIENKTEASID